MKNKLRLSTPVHMYAEISRHDPETHEVEGWCYTSPTVRGDKWNIPYETMKAAAERYMQAPCVRAMHQAIAAGHGLALEFFDDVKRIKIRAKITDQNEWNKVQEGTYRGFSIYGIPEIIQRGTNTVLKMDWVETSLVDRPKDGGAMFTIARSEEVPTEFEVQELDETDDAEEIARLLTSTTPDVPVRENLEGRKWGAPLVKLQSRLTEVDEERAYEAINSALWFLSDDVERAETGFTPDYIARLEQAQTENTALIARVEAAENSVATLQTERDELATQAQTLEGELSIARGELATRETRLTDAEGTISRLEGEVTVAGETISRLETQVQTLRDTPLPNQAMQYTPTPLARDFRANQLLEQQNSAEVQRGELKKEHTDLQARLLTEPDQNKREAGARKLMELQMEINRLS